MEILTSQTKGNYMTNIKENKFEALQKKSDKINKSLSIPKLTKEKVEKYISTQPINVMTNTLQTLSVDRKNVNWSDDSKSDANKINQMKNWYSYYQQIENNLVVGAKAVFLVCRDLYDASRKLSADDFELLKSKVHLSEATISKYMTIGKSTTCSELFAMNKLPESWTTMYKVAKLKDNDAIKKVKSNINLGSTNEDIDVFMGVVKETLKPLYNYNDLENPKDFIRVAYDNKHNVDPIALEMLKKEVTNLVYDKIDEFNSIQKAYFLDKEKEEDVRVEVACNEKLLTTAYDKAMSFLKKVKGKDKVTGETASMSAFKKVKAKYIDYPQMFNAQETA